MCRRFKSAPAHSVKFRAVKRLRLAALFVCHSLKGRVPNVCQTFTESFPCGFPCTVNQVVCYSEVELVSRREICVPCQIHYIVFTHAVCEPIAQRRVPKIMEFTLSNISSFQNFPKAERSRSFNHLGGPESPESEFSLLKARRIVNRY